MEEFIYLDYASTTPIDDEVLDEMLPYFNGVYGNASSGHLYGQVARKAVLEAQLKIANVIRVDREEIYFTSGATESINLALKGAFFSKKVNGNHIITVKTEHKAVLDTCSYLEEVGAEVTYLNVDDNGLINLDDLRSSIKDSTFLVCVMYVNNETGVLQPIKEIGDLCRDNNIIFMSDATQAYGKIPLDVESCNIDLLCFSGHKIYAPKGVGGLYVKKGIALEMQIHGGGHQNKVRSGTLNVPGIIGLGKASEVAQKRLEIEYERIKEIRNYLESKLIQQSKGIVNGFNSERSPFISSIQLIGQEADRFILMNRKNLAVATGSACNSEVVQVSHVLKAMNLDKVESESTIRVSYGVNTMVSDIEYLMSVIK